eukprot:Skav234111  [mRNA]  locus=scaffold4487:2400:6291:+ [translate_table: standard]
MVRWYGAWYDDTVRWYGAIAWCDGMAQYGATVRWCDGTIRWRKLCARSPATLADFGREAGAAPRDSGREDDDRTSVSGREPNTETGGEASEFLGERWQALGLHYGEVACCK